MPAQKPAYQLPESEPTYTNTRFWIITFFITALLVLVGMVLVATVPAISQALTFPFLSFLGAAAPFVTLAVLILVISFTFAALAYQIFAVTSPAPRKKVYANSVAGSHLGSQKTTAATRVSAAPAPHNKPKQRAQDLKVAQRKDTQEKEAGPGEDERVVAQQAQGSEDNLLDQEKGQVFFPVEAEPRRSGQGSFEESEVEMREEEAGPGEEEGDRNLEPRLKSGAELLAEMEEKRAVQLEAQEQEQKNKAELESPKKLPKALQAEIIRRMAQQKLAKIPKQAPVQVQAGEENAEVAAQQEQGSEQEEIRRLEGEESELRAAERELDQVFKTARELGLPKAVRARLFLEKELTPDEENQKNEEKEEELDQLFAEFSLKGEVDFSDAAESEFDMAEDTQADASTLGLKLSLAVSEEGEQFSDWMFENKKKLRYAKVASKAESEVVKEEDPAVELALIRKALEGAQQERRDQEIGRMRAVFPADAEERAKEIAQEHLIEEVEVSQEISQEAIDQKAQEILDDALSEGAKVQIERTVGDIRQAVKECKKALSAAEKALKALEKKLEIKQEELASKMEAVKNSPRKNLSKRDLQRDLNLAQKAESQAKEERILAERLLYDAEMARDEADKSLRIEQDRLREALEIQGLVDKIEALEVQIQKSSHRPS